MLFKEGEEEGKEGRRAGGREGGREGGRAFRRKARARHFTLPSLPRSLGARKSAQALNGRWFAGRMIVVEFISVKTYLQKYPKAEEEEVEE